MASSAFSFVRDSFDFGKVLVNFMNYLQLFVIVYGTSSWKHLDTGFFPGLSVLFYKYEHNDIVLHRELVSSIKGNIC